MSRDRLALSGAMYDSRRTGMASRQRRANAGPRQQQQRSAKRSLLPALEVPSSPYKEAAPEQCSPAALLPVDSVAKQLILQSIDDFILQLPLGTDRTSADIEAAVAAELLDLHLANYQLKQRLVKWTSATQELQDLVQEQQCDICQLQEQLQQTKRQQEQQQQLDAANAAMQQQLQGATSKLQEMELAMKKLMEQQSLGANLDASKLVAERDAAAAQLVEAGSTAAAAQQDAARLRRALLDAEIDTQRASVAADSARQKVAELEAELAKARAQVAAARAEAETNQRQLAAAESAAAASSAQLLQVQAAASQAQLDAAKARQDVEQQLAAVKLQCQGCAEKAGQILDLQDELQGIKASNIRLEMAVQQEQRTSRGLIQGLEECKADLNQARGEFAEAVRARDQLYVQLYGGQSFAAGTGVAGAPVGCMVHSECVQCAIADLSLLPWGSAAGGLGHSPIKHPGTTSGTELQQQQQRGQQQQSGQEGLIQKYSSMQSQLQQQDSELRSLRQQLLELQLQLSDAQSAADIARQQLEQTNTELAAAKSAQQQATAAAASAKSTAEQLKQDLLQVQWKLQQQSPELAAATLQVERLEAQQKVLLSDMQESVDAAAAAIAAQTAAVSKAEGLQTELAELHVQHGNAYQRWKEEQAQLLQTKEQLIQQLSVAEAAARTALEKVALQHQQQIQQLSADHVAQVDTLRGELAAGATHRAGTESRLQDLQLEHAKQIAEAHAKTQQAIAHQQRVQRSLDDKESEVQQLSHKLAKAEEALAAAKHEAEAQLTAASTTQQALRQQLLEVRGERLQLQEKLTVMQSSSGSSQQLVQQMVAAQQDAAAVAGELRQQLHHAQSQLQEQQTQLQGMQSENTLLEQKLAEAVAAKEAAARQAAAAGEKLAVSVAAHEVLKLQIAAGGRDVAGQSWDQQQQQPIYGLQASWQPHELQHNPLYVGSVAGSQSTSPVGSPYRAGQLERTRQQLNQLAQTLAERDAELGELNSELEQAQAENQQLYEQHQLLKAEVAALQGRSSRSGTQGLPHLAQLTVAQSRAMAGDGSANKVQYALAELAQLTVAMEALERRLAQQAAANSQALPSSNMGAVSAGASAAARTGSPVSSSSSASPGNRSEALVAAAIAVADLRRQVRRLSTELQEEEHAEQLQQKLNGVAQPVQQVQSLRNMVRELSTELTEKESVLATLPELQQRLSEVSAQLALKEKQATDVTSLLRHVADLQQQLAAAQAEARAAAVADGAASNISGSDDSALLRQQVADLQQQLAAAQAEAKAAAAVAAASVSSGRDDSATLQTLLSELMQLKRQLDDATARDAGAEAEVTRLKHVVKDLQTQLQASQATVQQVQNLQAEVQAAEAAKEKVQAELRFLQGQFEDVTGELHSKAEQLRLQQAQVLLLQQQLTAAEVTSQAELKQQQQLLLSLQQQLVDAQAQEASARAELEAARQQIQQLQQQMIPPQQQQEQADEPSGIAHKMQALLMQKDRDIQKSQQQLQVQQLQAEQLSEQLQQSLPPSAWPSAAGEHASAVSGSRDIPQAAAAAAVASAADLGSSSGHKRWATAHSIPVTLSSTAADADALSAYSSMHSTTATRQGVHSMQSSMADESVGAAAAGQQLLMLQSATTDQLPRTTQWAAGASSQSASGSSLEYSSRWPIEGLGGLDPKHIQQSLRSTSINSRSGNGSTGKGRSWSDSSGGGVSVPNSASRPLSLAASRSQSIGQDMPSPSLFPARMSSSAASATAAATAAAAAQIVRSSSDSGWGGSRRASEQSAAALVEPLHLQLMTSAPDRLSQQQQQQQRSESLSCSPSKRATAALAAQGLARLPSRSLAAAAAGQGHSYSRSGLLKWDGGASPAAMQSDARNVRVPATLEKSTVPSAVPSQLTSTAESRALSRQVSRAAATAAAVITAPDSMFSSSSSDEDDARDTVGTLGGVGSVSTNSRRNTGTLRSAPADAHRGSIASGSANSSEALSRPRSASELQYMLSSRLSVSGRSRGSNSMNISESQQKAGVRSATGAAAVVTEQAEIGTLSSGISSMNSTCTRGPNIHRLSDGLHSSELKPQAQERQQLDSANSIGSYSRSSSGNSRAKLLVTSSQGGYDAQKLQKSLSTTSRQLQQQPAPDTAAATAVAPITARRRAVSATGSGSTLSTTSNTIGMIHSSSTNLLLDRLNQTAPSTSGAVSSAANGQQPHRASTGTPCLKPALSRAARVASVMASGRGSLHSSVSFKEPIRSTLEGSMHVLASPEERTQADELGQTAKDMHSTSDAKAARAQRSERVASATDGVGSEKVLSRSSSRRQQAVLQTAARLLEASDSD